MVNVDPIEGITYGMRLIGYLIAVGIISGIVFAIGFVLTGGLAAEGESGAGVIIGFLFILAGSLVFYGGILGLSYKLIADAVEKGINASQGSVGAGGQPRQRRTQQRQNQRKSGQRQSQRKSGQRQNQQGSRNR